MSPVACGRSRPLKSSSKQIGLARFFGALKYVLIAATIILYAQIRMEIDAVRDNSSGQLFYHARLEEAAKLQMEFQNFLLDADRYTNGQGNVTRNDVLLSFDLVWSRVSVLASAEDYEIVRMLEGIGPLFSTIETVLHELDPLVQHLQTEDLATLNAIKIKTEKLREPLKKLSAAAYARRLKEATDQSNTNRQIAGKLDNLQTVIAVAFLLSFIFIFAEMLATRRANRTLQQHEEHIRTLAYTDPLTGLANRRALQEHLSSALGGADGACVQLILIDLDNFKDVNDVHGHPAGDSLIQDVAARLSDVFADSGFVSRMGGDEFAVILNADRPTTTAYADKLLSTLRQPVFINGAEFIPTASIGIAQSIPNAQMSQETLLRHADIALYESKRAGRDCYCLFEDGQLRQYLYRRTIEDDLPAAIDLDELEVHYQPQYGLKTGEVHGVEALVRWHHRSLGNIPALDIVSSAEQTGMIDALGNFVLARACRDMVTLIASSPDLRLAVNVSALQVNHKNFMQNVVDILRNTGFPANRLTLEITESVMMSELPLVAKNVSALTDFGVAFAIDDFGSAYSNMGTLTHVPFRYLKIDKAFVHDLIGSEQNAAIIKGIVSLADNLKMTLICEGVESNAQALALRNIGVPVAQGYLFARPMPLLQFVLLLGGKRNSDAEHAGAGAVA